MTKKIKKKLSQAITTFSVCSGCLSSADSEVVVVLWARELFDWSFSMIDVASTGGDTGRGEKVEGGNGAACCEAI